jgi:dsRNA-specific ribonuclease
VHKLGRDIELVNYFKDKTDLSLHDCMAMLLAAIWLDSNYNEVRQLILKHCFKIENFSAILKEPPPQAKLGASSTHLSPRETHSDSFLELENKLRHNFKYKQLLAQALTRQSAIEEGLALATITSFQRLEFLGDRILNFVIANLLFSDFPCAARSDLTQHLIKAIHNEGPLAQVAKVAGLPDSLIMGKGEDSLGLRGSNKALSDHLEALIAAIWLDNILQDDTSVWGSSGYTATEAFIRYYWNRLDLIAAPTLYKVGEMIVSADKETSLGYSAINVHNPAKQFRFITREPGQSLYLTFMEIGLSLGIIIYSNLSKSAGTATPAQLEYFQTKEQKRAFNITSCSFIARDCTPALAERADTDWHSETVLEFYVARKDPSPPELHIGIYPALTKEAVAIQLPFLSSKLGPATASGIERVTQVYRGKGPYH